MNLLVSACLLGIKCRYDAKECCCEQVIQLCKTNSLIPVCPEQLGGLKTPRDPVELKNSQAITKNGEDKTTFFEHGAKETLKLAKLFDCKGAILKSKSPSCGYGTIYDGSFTGTLTQGTGITAKLLLEHGIFVIDEFQTEKLKEK